MDKKIAHLGFIQNIITRMGNNSFLIKGWAFTIVLALVSLNEKSLQVSYFLPYFVILFFWMFDSYFLTQERLFRKLYQKVIEEENTTFLMDVGSVKLSDYAKAMFSATLGFFYGGMFVFTLITHDGTKIAQIYNFLINKPFTFC